MGKGTTHRALSIVSTRGIVLGLSNGDEKFPNLC